jgi:hypothetical protein
MIEPTRKALDEYIKAAESLDDNLDFTKANRKKWSWCDALYMSPPTFARMYRLTGDEKYRDYLHTWWWKVSDYYYDADEHLYYRDETFFEKREPNGKKIFWSRGNGWVVGGLVRVLQALQKDDPMRLKYVTQFKEMCNKLADIQAEDGLWRSGLLDPVAHTQPETSGSAFFVYAMAYGVNQGILDRDRFMPVIKKAWSGLSRHLQADGRFTGIQPVGDSPRKYNANNTMPYGVGAFLLAGSEVYKLSAEAQKQSKKQAWAEVLASGDYMEIAKAYADYMIEHGRDRYGKIHSPLFVSAMNRKTGKVFKAPYPHVIAKPYAPGLRRDHKMRPYDRSYVGGNPIQDIPLYGLLYRLSELIGQKRYAEEADKSIDWFLSNTQAKSGLFPWGSHMYYHVETDQGVYSAGRYGGHEYNYVWPYWEQNPEALKRFAHGVWNQHVKNKKTGHFNRHSNDGKSGMEFPRTGSCFMEVWAREYGRSGDPQMKTAIQTLLKLFGSMRNPQTGAMAWCTAEGADRREVANVSMNLYMATTLQDAAGHVDKRDPELAEELRKLVRFIDDEYLSNDYDKILDIAGKGILSWYTLTDRTCMAKGFTPPPDGVDASIGFPLTSPDGNPAASLYYLTPWFPGRSYAEFALLLRDRHERCEKKHTQTYRRALIDIADIYMTINPEIQFAQYPDNISDVVELLRYVYKITDNVAYLHRADYIMRLGLRLFFDKTSPLPKITNFDDWYESSAKNESSVEILRQMLELSLDLKTLPEMQRRAPHAVAEERADMWHARLDRLTENMILRYGPEKQHKLYLSQSTGENGWQISLSDTITRIPTAAEADEINGRMKQFTGKGHTISSIDYGGFKDVPRQVTLVIRNSGKKIALVQVEATLHDTYHDNGRQQSSKTIKPGQRETFVFTAPAYKWIRRLSVTSDNGSSDLSLERFAFVMTTRNKLADKPGQDAAASSSGKTYYVDAAGGDDENHGTSAQKAWKTLTPVNSMILVPGDKVLLKSGCEFTDPSHRYIQGMHLERITPTKYFSKNPDIESVFLHF